ncbi:MAG TPA: GspH/FimT family pseudopilin [Gemmatimonadales bacterium]|nr:GspH/FimT family pseudopilin [Gemmatimonadales bacterium]
MRNGHSLLELVVVLTIVSTVTALVTPKAAAWLDWIAVERAAQDFISAVAVTRHRAVLSGLRTQLDIARDSLRFYELSDTGWVAGGGWVGPGQFGVAVTVSNPTLAFDPLGLAVGPSNTRVVLERGLQVATITTSRLGRLKRW